MSPAAQVGPQRATQVLSGASGLQSPPVIGLSVGSQTTCTHCQSLVLLGRTQVTVEAQPSPGPSEVSKLAPTEVPYGDQALPLGEYLTPSTGARILSVAFINLFSLLMWN